MSDKQRVTVKSGAAAEGGNVWSPNSVKPVGFQKRFRDNLGLLPRGVVICCFLAFIAGVFCIAYGIHSYNEAYNETSQFIKSYEFESSTVIETSPNFPVDSPKGEQ